MTKRPTLLKAEDMDRENEGEFKEGLSPNVQSAIGWRLKAYYRDLVREPVPEHLIKLLDDLQTTEDQT